jgi:hypothetical protein
VPVQRVIQPVTTGITSEDPAGAVAAMGGRSKADDEETRGGIPESGNRPAPVLLPGKFPLAPTRDLRAVGPESGAQLTVRNEVGESAEGRGRGGEQAKL